MLDKVYYYQGLFVVGVHFLQAEKEILNKNLVGHIFHFLVFDLQLTVKVKYGLKTPQSSLLVLAPCHSRNMPRCVEVFNG